MKYIKKYWFIIIIIALSIIRFLISYKLPNFYLNNLSFDDKLMINNLESLLNGDYLGRYNSLTIVKGLFFPAFLSFVRLINIRYSIILTILYILSCLYLIISLNKIINNKKIIIVIYFFILFNPISYSSEVFQRLYRNSLSIVELLFFLGTIINIVNKKNKVINYVILGIILSIMFLTREDSIWTIIVLLFLISYVLYKNWKFKTILICLIPFFILEINLNIISFINYKHYGIYTYNEIEKSSFKKAYIKILQIKDDKKNNQVSVTKNMLLQLSEHSKTFNFTKEEIEKKYDHYGDSNGEIYNGNIVWYLRGWIFNKNNFQNGDEAEDYFKQLNQEIEQLFSSGKLKRSFAIPFLLLNTPTFDYIKKYPNYIFKTIIYTSTYRNVKTFDINNIFKIKDIKYDYKNKAYSIRYLDYHNAENMIDKNSSGYEVIRSFYEFFTIILSFVALVIYFINFKKNDKLGIIIHMLLISYLIIILGVSYTHVTAFNAIRYIYLCNVYLLQNLFILLNLSRIKIKKRQF